MPHRAVLLELLPMIRDQDDDRGVAKAELIEMREQSGDLRVDITDLAVVEPQDVAAILRARDLLFREEGDHVVGRTK